MKYNVLLLMFAVILQIGCQSKNKSGNMTATEDFTNSTRINTLTQAEKAAGWKLLFDDKTTAGWQNYNGQDFPGEKWKIEDGVLTVLATKSDENFIRGSIITTRQIGDFELMLECRLTPGANSGIKYYVLVDEYKKRDALGLEYQLFDDTTVQGNLSGNTHTMASLYDLLPSHDVQAKPIGEWNRVRIYSKDNRVEHWLNGEKVLSYNRGSDEFRERVAQSKFSKYPGFGEAEKGHIMLQDHKDEVSFRNIKIREL